MVCASKCVCHTICLSEQTPHPLRFAPLCNMIRKVVHVYQVLMVGELLCRMLSFGHLVKPLQQPIRWVLLLFPFYRGGNWGSLRLNLCLRQVVRKGQSWVATRQSSARATWFRWAVELASGSPQAKEHMQLGCSPWVPVDLRDVFAMMMCLVCYSTANWCPRQG